MESILIIFVPEFVVAYNRRIFQSDERGVGEPGILIYVGYKLGTIVVQELGHRR